MNQDSAFWTTLYYPHSSLKVIKKKYYVDVYKHLDWKCTFASEHSRKMGSKSVCGCGHWARHHVRLWWRWQCTGDLKAFRSQIQCDVRACHPIDIPFLTNSERNRSRSCTNFGPACFNWPYTHVGDGRKLSKSFFADKSFSIYITEKHTCMPEPLNNDSILFLK